MKFLNFGKPEDINELEERVAFADDIEKMCKTPGWKRLEALLKEQSEAYIHDNATNASDWNDYMKKSGKIFGIQLMFADIADILIRGEQAKEELSKLKD